MKKNTSRMNRLEELGRVDSEKAYTAKGKKNLSAEKKRIVKELSPKQKKMDKNKNGKIDAFDLKSMRGKKK